MLPNRACNSIIHSHANADDSGWYGILSGNCFWLKLPVVSYQLLIGSDSFGLPQSDFAASTEQPGGSNPNTNFAAGVWVETSSDGAKICQHVFMSVGELRTMVPSQQDICLTVCVCATARVVFVSMWSRLALACDMLVLDNVFYSRHRPVSHLDRLFWWHDHMTTVKYLKGK